MQHKLYQTLEDRSNIDEIERIGPFKCRRDDAWLGEGYYYWDNFISHAHWWGEVSYKYRNKDYVICQSNIDFSQINIYDLDDTVVLQEFNEITKALRKAYPNKNITVPVVIEHLKRNIKDFQKYHVIKARGNNAAKYNRPTTYRLNFNTNNEAYLDLRPQIQLCFLSKAIIGDNNFKVIYPEQYAVGYII